MTSTPEPAIVLITGANKGVGFATARHVARAGHRVLVGARDPGRGEAAAVDLAGQGLDVDFVHVDVTDPATIAAAATLIDELMNSTARSRTVGPSRAPRWCGPWTTGTCASTAAATVSPCRPSWPGWRSRA
jgi:NAD(P)-dependent dehydrogenase (short-subunit alcohol dehydrogenase family)